MPKATPKKRRAGCPKRKFWIIRRVWLIIAATVTRATTRAWNTRTWSRRWLAAAPREAFAANGFTADQIYVNVQALSGAPANNAVYQALLNLGDTVMGLNLLHGGHLSHGSSVNRQGKWFKAVHYTVDENEKLDYDKIRAQALETKPKLIIAGYSSYSWVPDWKKFREIADEVGAYFLADISHIGGLVAAGVVPSPIGIAHVVMSTTHKSLDGPRGAVLLTTDAAIAKKIDKAVFPGEQGGPHVNVFAALALTFKLAQTKQFKKLQAQTIKNAQAMADQFKKRGLRVPFGGTDSHLVNVDTTTIKSPEGIALSGDQAARILDIVGIVVNRNTIPGDKNSADPSGHPPRHAVDHAARLQRKGDARAGRHHGGCAAGLRAARGGYRPQRTNSAARSWISMC